MSRTARLRDQTSRSESSTSRKEVDLDLTQLDHVQGGASAHWELQPEVFRYATPSKPRTAGLDLWKGVFYPEDRYQVEVDGRIQSRAVAPVCYLPSALAEQGITKGFLVRDTTPQTLASAERLGSSLADNNPPVRDVQRIVHGDVYFADEDALHGPILDGYDENERPLFHIGNQLRPGHYPDGLVRNSPDAPETALPAIQEYGCNPQMIGPPRAENEPTDGIARGVASNEQDAAFSVGANEEIVPRDNVAELKSENVVTADPNAFVMTEPLSDVTDDNNVG